MRAGVTSKQVEDHDLSEDGRGRSSVDANSVKAGKDIYLEIGVVGVPPEAKRSGKAQELGGPGDMGESDGIENGNTAEGRRRSCALRGRRLVGREDVRRASAVVVMANKSLYIIFFISSLVLLNILASDTVLDVICRQTHDPSLCTSIIECDPCSLTTGILMLVEDMIDMGTDLAIGTKVKIHSLLLFGKSVFGDDVTLEEISSEAVQGRPVLT
ncbi:quaternary ammonium compound-resistance protein SugE [Striga asiatica]|uniref:Quaternary ammonium compound-resistance protein SugE n=1 Tax=Striga asiatica TaxID=4170 RepID=A0A5A7R0W0_STRAF|nr:quaternary ammonium compound-resistance protein SugE [Striga asiatica]